MILMDYVDAIEDGRIVKVAEKYAHQEGLLILRRNSSFSGVSDKQKVEDFVKKQESRRMKTPLDLDKFRKPLDYKKTNIVSDLKDNFHWEIARSRKARALSRQQLASILGVREEDIKLIENGIMPRQDFVLVSKIEKYFGINLRKESMEERIENPANQSKMNASALKKEDEINLSEAIQIDDFGI